MLNISDHTLRHFHTTNFVAKKEGRKEMMASMPKPDEGNQGEKAVDLDAAIHGRLSIFPDENTPDMLVDGVRFADLPICHIKTSPNNTLLCITDPKGLIKMIRFCGMEGFKNTRKGTNVAAQATAITLGTRAVRAGIVNVRVMVKGLGPGRMSAIKGLTMAGVNVVSVTDTTPVPWTASPRPKKMRRL
uniref:EOG090X0DZ9 n=1 Tax=Lynceus sp. MCZ IZ 141354 TaxID=1930659 RepID=A0A9N6WRK2_9CRUS|nr:EOG090X0DZ9 [Lynceus sp. MCZ IZ 141354]